MSCEAVGPCEPRPRAVPVEGPPLPGRQNTLYGLPVARYGIVEPFLTEELQPSPEMVALEQTLQQMRELAAEWLRGFDYELLGEGHYEDE